MNPIALHVMVSGRVQGVWFRQSLKEQADTHGVRGWVRNRADGQVEALLSGEANAVRDVEAWLGVGPPLATVAEVIATEVEVPELGAGFEVR